MTQPTTEAIEQARAFAVIDPHWGEPRIMLDTIRSTREQALEDALWNRELSLYSGIVLDRVPAIKGQWERLERQLFKVEEVSIDALSAAASEREQLEARVKALEVAGKQLANVAYNIHQRGQVDAGSLRSLNAARLGWDDALEIKQP